MAQAARPSAPKYPNPCAAFRPPPPPPAGRPDAAAQRPARPKDAPCPASSGDRGDSGQCKKAPDTVMPKPSGGKYSKPDARVKLIPAEDIITYARHGKPFRSDLQKSHCRRSVTPPPSLARPTLLTQKATAALSHKATAQFTNKAATPHSHRATVPPPPVSSCLPAKIFETAGNRKNVSLKRPSPLCKAVQRGAVPPATLQKESEMNPISPSSVHVPPAHSSKVPLAIKAELSRSVSTPTESHIRNERQTNLEASISCNMSSGAPPISHTKLYKKPDQSKSTTQAPHIELANDFEAVPSTKIHIRNERQANQEASVSCSMSSGTPPISHTKLYKKPDQSKSTTQAPRIDLANDFEAVPSSKIHIRNERQANQEASVSCSMSSGAPSISHAQLYKKPDQSKSTTQAPRIELDNGFEAVPSTTIHIRNERQANQEASVSCTMSSGAQAILDTELYKKPYQPESKTPGPCVDLSIDLDAKSHIRNERQTNQEASISCNMPSGAPLILHTEPCKKTSQPQACWKGKFEVTGQLTHTCDELEAHFPFEIFIKVYEASKQMPEILKLEALPLSHLLPRKFKMVTPDAQDIGLFFRSSCQRANRNFDHLLENVSSHIGLRTDIGATELLIFSSRLLIEDDQTQDGKFYLCGVFQKPHRKKSGIRLELTGKEEINGINKCMPILKTPDANATSNAAPAVSFLTGSCSPVSAGSPCKAAPRAPACGDLILDSPPGFPHDVPPPGFSSAHRWLRTGGTAESQIDPGDVPPGFTPAHRGLHTGEVNEKHDKVAVQVDDDTEERKFPKIKRLSDILGFSSSNNASTSSRLRNCSEICTSAAAVPRASKFQETGPSGIEKLGRKRGQPEPSEASADEAAKRLKLNGRIVC